MVFILVKKKLFPQVHVLENKFELSLSVTNKQSTIYPVIMQDEGLPAPDTIETNPENSTFAEVNKANCHRDSKVFFARVVLEFSMAKGAIETDFARVMRMATFPISTAFLENLEATNDLTSEQVEDICELQHETTDKQCFPLWNGTKLTGLFPDLGDTTGSGLTTNGNIEGVTFVENKIYDALQYFTNGKKVRNTLGSIRWRTISRDRVYRISYTIKSKTKAINPYTFFGIGILVPKEATYNQFGIAADFSAISHIHVKVSARYNEYNDSFNSMR